MNEKQFRIRVCDCGLCDGELHTYIWTMNGDKFGPFTLSFAAVITLIELALKEEITTEDAVNGGMFAVMRMPSALDGGGIMTPAADGLAYVKKRVGAAGHELAEAIFAQSIEEEEALAEMFEGEAKKPVPPIRAVV